MIGWFKAYRLPETLAGTAGLCALTLWLGSRTLEVATQTPIPATWFLALGLVLVSALPLANSLGLLERTFSRARPLKALRAAAAAFTIALGAVCLVAAGSTPGLLAWLFLAAAATVLATTLLGQRALLLAVALGTGSILLEHWMSNTPVSHFADTVSTPLAAGLFAISLLVFGVKTERSG